MKKLLLATAVLASTNSVYATPPAASPAEQQITALIQKMTLKEKVDLVSGNDPTTNAIPRLHIPAITMNDGPLGVRLGHSTAFPSGLTQGSAFDPELISAEGAAIADEATTKGVNMMLGPCVNISREPFGGRNFESYGEDPLIASVMAASYIKGMQSRNVIATVKHFAANDQEIHRNTMSSNVDTRTLFEIHFPAFKAAVDAGVYSLMTSYNKVNGTWASENGWLVTTVLKQMWGFDGFVVSDWTSTHSTVQTAEAGLDLEMPTGVSFGPKLIAAVRAGKVPMKVVDDKVRRLLRVMFAIGLMGPKKALATAVEGPSSTAHQALAQKIAEEGTVLLANDGTLPLDIGGRVKTIAAIGPHAGRLRTGGGGSSHVEPFNSVSPFEALKTEVAGRATVTLADGVTIPGDLGRVMTADDFKDGLIEAQYYHSLEELFDGKHKPFTSRKERAIELSTASILDDRYGVRMTGEFKPAMTGTYTFSSRNSHTQKVYVDGKKIIDQTASTDYGTDEVDIPMAAGKTYKLVVETGRGDDDTEPGLQVGVRTPSPNRMTDAVAAAKAADVAVLFLGMGNDLEGEGVDRQSLDLPADQLALLNAVTAVQPNTVVVLTGGGPFMMPWLSKVKAVMQAWYPGSEGGHALARLLTGSANPSGKLPISYIKDWKDSSAYGRYPDVNLVTNYSEGIFVGYRYMDRTGKQPLFPFGYGLSYTSFAIKNLKAMVVDKLALNPHVSITFDVTNTGDRDGAEVAQVYVGEELPSVPRPVRELKGFKRVALKAGETQTVTIDLDKSAFAFFDVPSMSWKVDAAAFDISVGSSSRDLPLTTTIQLEK